MNTHIKMKHNTIILHENLVVFIMKNKKIRKIIAKMTKSTDCQQKNQTLYHAAIKYEHCNKTKHHNKSHHLC